MIPRDYITAWRPHARWVQHFQVEQDLIISRALVEIFSDAYLRSTLAFRGGTALYKLHIKPAARYSEDIDLVQSQAGPIGPTLDALRRVLDPWLGRPARKQNQGRVTLNYRFSSEDNPALPLRLKVEINSREHHAQYGFMGTRFDVASRWFTGTAEITTYELDELLATKLRALYQRKKGRDLFDLATALEQPRVNPDRVIAAFVKYMKREGCTVTRALFEKNLAEKLADPQFTADIEPLLTSGHVWNVEKAGRQISHRLISALPGLPWKGQSSRTGIRSDGFE